MMSLVELFMEAIGEGELQDSVIIGGIQYLMNDESFYCKRCKEPFSKLEMQANKFEDGLDGVHQNDAEAAESIVQLSCNPTHVFHQECI